MGVLPIVFVKEYENAYAQKQQILLENKGKTGIYCWENTINGKFYIGSAVDIKDRLRKYYSHTYLVNNSILMPICSALLKWGYANFKVYILEYCEKENLIQREQYYFDKLNPNYNVCRTAGSTLGRIHSEETKEKLSLLRKGKKFDKHTEETKQQISQSRKGKAAGLNHPMFGKSHTEETKNKMRQAKLGKNHPMFEKTLSEEHKAKISASQGNRKKVSVLDLETNTETIYNSLREAARALNCLVGSLSSNINKGKRPYKGRYILKFLD